MGVMSDLHLLATRVLEGDETAEAVANDSAYSLDDIEYAVRELRKANRQT